MEGKLVITGVLVATAAVIAVILLCWAWRHSVWATSEQARWEDCAACEGCGVVMLDGSPISREHRTFYRSVTPLARRAGVIQGRIANTRDCGDCKGMGHSWKYRGDATVFSSDWRPGGRG